MYTLLCLVSLAKSKFNTLSKNDFKYYDIYEFIINESNKAIITNITSPQNDLSILSSIPFEGNNLEVVSLEKQNENSISSISGTLTIPDSVQYIGDYFFSYLPISDVQIGNGLIEIGSYAFASSQLEYDIILPSSLQIIGSNAFTLTNIMSLTIPDGSQLQKIGDGAFYNCTELSGTLSFPQSLNEIGNLAFCNTYIETLYFDPGVKITVIPWNSFANTQLYGDLMIPKSIKTIGTGAFSKTFITSLTFADNSELTHIESMGFFHCNYLSNTLIIPDSVEILDTLCFGYCAIQGIQFGSNSVLQKIGDQAFVSDYLTAGTLTLPRILLSIGVGAFYYTGFTEIVFGQNPLLQTIGESCFAFSSLSGSIEFPSNLQTIGEAAFQETKINAITFARGSVLNVIDHHAFRSILTITEPLTLPSKLTIIGDNAFFNTSIPELIIPEDSKLTNIGEGAFYKSAQMTGNLVFPGSIQSIKGSAFSETLIESIAFGKNSFYFTAISEFSFSHCSNLSCIVIIPQSILIIERYAFYNSTISGLQFEEKSALTTINTYAFAFTYITDTVEFPESLTTIDVYAFADNYLTEIVFHEKCAIEKLGLYAFAYSNELRSIQWSTVPIDKLSGSAFEECPKLENLTLQANTIGDSCFLKCTSLYFVTFTIYVKVIERQAFALCTNLTLINFPVMVSVKIGQYAFARTNITSVSVCTTLEQNEFSHCPNLETLDITGDIDNPQLVSQLAIVNCSSLKTIQVGFATMNFVLLESLPQLEKIDIYMSNVVFNNRSCCNLPNLQILKIRYFSNATFESYSFQNSPKMNIQLDNTDQKAYITRVDEYAFDKCPSLDPSIEIQEFVGVKSFGDFMYESLTVTAKYVSDYAYYSSDELKYVKIAPTVEFIGNHIIENCPKFESLEFLDVNITEPSLVISKAAIWKIDTFELRTQLPNRLTILNTQAFAHCTKITGSLEIPMMLEIIDQSAFEGCLNLNGFLDFSKCQHLHSIGKCAFLGCSKLRGTLSLPPTLLFIGEYAFTYCNFAGPLVIPDSVINISSHAFSMCSTFTGSLIIGINVTHIGSFAFSECTGLNGQLEIHSTKLENIGNNAFYGCRLLQGMLNLPQSVTYIGDFAFFNCEKFENSLILPQNIEYIGASAFAYCIGFTGILVIPNTIMFIGNNAFFQCSGFTEITFPKHYSYANSNSVLVIEDKAFGNLKIKCLSNVPIVCSIKNSSNKNGYEGSGESRCYDSTEFNWIAKIGTLSESCSAKKGWEISFNILTSIVALTVASFIFKFGYAYINNLYTESKRIKAIFDEIIEKARNNYNNDEDEVQSVRNAVSRIQKQLTHEANNPKFTFKKRKLVSILNNSFTTKWPSVQYNIKVQIIEESLNDNQYTFKHSQKPKHCCKKCSLLSCCSKFEESSYSADNEMGSIHESII